MPLKSHFTSTKPIKAVSYKNSLQIIKIHIKNTNFYSIGETKPTGEIKSSLTFYKKARILFFFWFKVHPFIIIFLSAKKEILRENLEEDAKIIEENTNVLSVTRHFLSLCFSNFLSHIFLSPRKRCSSERCRILFYLSLSLSL